MQLHKSSATTIILGALVTLLIPVSHIKADTCSHKKSCKKQCEVKACDDQKTCPKLLHGRTTFIPRSQGDNTARELAGWQQKLFRCYDSNYAAIAATVEYTRSFDTECIAKQFFSTNCLTFSGSEFPLGDEGVMPEERPPGSIVADYFGLPTDFNGTLAIKPLIQNIIIDINLYFGLDTWAPGLYLRVSSPIVHTRWTLGLDECLPCDQKFRGCTVFPECYMSSLSNGDARPIQDPDCPVPADNPARKPPPCPVNTTLHPPKFLRNNNCTTQDLRDALSGNFTFGDMTEPWEFGKFSFCPRSKTGIADIDVSLGWNIVQNDYAHFGFFATTVVPTGNRPKAKYIFEPLIGDGKHWKLGGGVSGHISLYPYSDDDAFNMGIYFDGRLVKVFDTDQMRSFDFKAVDGEGSRLMSRYILLKEYNTAGEYNGRMINAINYATRNCNVSVGMLADISVKAFIAINSWEFDIGYNFYYREREKVCIKTECPCPLDSRIFAIKGLQGVCCVNYPNIEQGFVQPRPTTKLPLDADQFDATMFDPQLPEGLDEVPEFGPVCLSWNSPRITEPTPIDEITREDGFVIADTEASPTFISCADLDRHSAEQGEMRTHKVFGHLGYTFNDSTHTPYVGIGAEGEFDACNKNALQQWGIWLKGGVLF